MYIDLSCSHIMECGHLALESPLLWKGRSRTVFSLKRENGVRSVISLRECAHCLKCRGMWRQLKQATVAGYGNEGAVNLGDKRVGLEVCTIDQDRCTALEK